MSRTSLNPSATTEVGTDIPPTMGGTEALRGKVIGLRSQSKLEQSWGHAGAAGCLVPWLVVASPHHRGAARIYCPNSGSLVGKGWLLA